MMMRMMRKRKKKMMKRRSGQTAGYLLGFLRTPSYQLFPPTVRITTAISV